MELVTISQVGVMDRVVEGKLSKDISEEFGITEGTVKKHRDEFHSRVAWIIDEPRFKGVQTVDLFRALGRVRKPSLPPLFPALDTKTPDEQKLLAQQAFRRREVQVMNLVGTGVKDEEISHQLEITLSTVGEHKENLYERARALTGLPYFNRYLIAQLSLQLGYRQPRFKRDDLVVKFRVAASQAQTNRKNEVSLFYEESYYPASVAPFETDSELTPQSFMGHMVRNYQGSPHEFAR